MSASAESTLGMTFSELRENIARHMGLDYPLPTADTAEVDDIIASALRQVYWPSAIEGIPPGFKWTFLRILKTGESITAPANTFALPDDYGGGISVINITNIDADPIQMMDRRHFEMQKIGGTDTTGTPRTACIYVSAGAGASESERYTVELFPVPNANLTLSYEYDVIPDMIGASVEYPYGAQLHSETILASCFAVEELRANDGDAGPYYQAFVRHLLTSIALDQEMATGIDRSELHPTTAPALTTLASDYNHLVSSIGDYLGYGYNTQTYTYNENQKILRYIERGIRKFYWFPAGQGIDSNHVWSFLQPVGTLNTVADQEDYDLPITVGSVIGRMTYNASDQYYPIDIVPEGKIRELRSSSQVDTGVPQYAAIRSKSDDATGENIYELMLWPTPDAVFALEYKYNYRPAKITSTNLYTMAGPEHGETILEACLSIVEADPKVGNSPGGPHDQAFMRQLAASIQRDKNAHTADYFGFNTDGGHDHGLYYRADAITYNGTNVNLL